MTTTDEYREAMAVLILGYSSLIEDDNDIHYLEYTEDGDGWNEPFSDDYRCACGEEITGWVQSDPKCTGRPDMADAAILWVAHVRKDVWKVDDGDLSQDSDPLQEGAEWPF